MRELPKGCLDDREVVSVTLASLRSCSAFPKCASALEGLGGEGNSEGPFAASPLNSSDVKRPEKGLHCLPLH